jgi:hypothetical protein
MLAFTNVMNFFTDEFAGLRRRRFAFRFVTPGAFESFLVGHNSFLPGSKFTSSCQ